MLRVALIHNGEQERLQYIRPLIDELTGALNCTQIEIEKQEFFDINFRDFMDREIDFLILRFRWMRNVSQKMIFLHFAKSTLRFIFRMGSFLIPQSREQIIRKMQIEDALTLKHFAAMQNFLEVNLNCDVLLILENDAIVEDFEYLASCLEFCLNDVDNERFFLFNHSHSFKALGFDCGDFSEQSSGLIRYLEYPRMITNTTVSYAANYNLIKLIHSQVSQQKRKIRFPIGWEINDAILKLQSDVEFHCPTCIFWPPPIINGSLSGYYSTSIPGH